MSATRAGTDKSGWHATKTRRSWSSWISSSDSTSANASTPAGPSDSSARPSCAYFAASVRSRRKRSIAFRLATAVSHAPGLAGCAVPGPLAESIDQRLLGQVLGQPDVTDAAGKGGDDTRELNPVDRLNGGGRIGGRHATDSTTPPFRPPGPIERFPLRLTGRGGRGPHPRPARRGTAWTTRLPRSCRGTPSAPSRRRAPWPRQRVRRRR